MQRPHCDREVMIEVRCNLRAVCLVRAISNDDLIFGGVVRDGYIEIDDDDGWLGGNRVEGRKWE